MESLRNKIMEICENNNYLAYDDYTGKSIQLIAIVELNSGEMCGLTSCRAYQSINALYVDDRTLHLSTRSASRIIIGFPSIESICKYNAKCQYTFEKINTAYFATGHVDKFN